MKLLISRDTSDSCTRFTVYDESERLLFNIKGKEGGAVRKIKAFTPDDKCVFKISATPEIGSTVGYNVVTPNSAFAVTVKLKASEMTLKIHGAKLFFKGSILERRFELTDVSSKALAFHKPEAGKRGQYTLEIYDETQTINLLAVSVCADLISFSDSAAMCRA